MEMCVVSVLFLALAMALAPFVMNCYAGAGDTACFGYIIMKTLAKLLSVRAAHILYTYFMSGKQKSMKVNPDKVNISTNSSAASQNATSTSSSLQAPGSPSQVASMVSKDSTNFVHNSEQTPQSGASSSS